MFLHTSGRHLRHWSFFRKQLATLIKITLTLYLTNPTLCNLSTNIKPQYIRTYIKGFLTHQFIMVQKLKQFEYLKRRPKITCTSKSWNYSRSIGTIPVRWRDIMKYSWKRQLRWRKVCIWWSYLLNKQK